MDREKKHHTKMYCMFSQIYNPRILLEIGISRVKSYDAKTNQVTASKHT